MANTYATYDDLLRTHPAMIALAHFIFNVYPQRAYAFHTSWSTYAFCETDEEQLLNAAFIAEKQRKNPSFDPNVETMELNYLRDVPTLVLNLCFHHAKSAADVNAAKKFVADAMSDAIHCHLNEIVEFDLYEAA